MTKLILMKTNQKTPIGISFNDTLTVVCSPIQATLLRRSTDALLDWSGGGPPYCVQHATDLNTGDWVDVLTDATHRSRCLRAARTVSIALSGIDSSNYP